MHETRHGYLYGLAAYGIWGLVPVYWKLLKPAGALDILANRIVWSVVFCALLLAALRRWRWLARVARSPRTLGRLTAAAVLIAINWGTYIYGVNSGHVVETSLGYFINPLVSILLAVLVLRERLRPPQWAAIGVGVAAVAVITVGYGHLPWLALVLAGAFGGYGLAKKTLGLPAAQGLFAESAILALPAAGYLVYLSYAGSGTFGTVSAVHSLLLIGGGLVTAVPLLLFAAAANRLPLASVGVLQYVTPILQLACGLLLFGEGMPATELVGFGLVWVALTVFTTDAVRHHRHALPASRSRDRRESAGTTAATVPR